LTEVAEDIDDGDDGGDDDYDDDDDGGYRQKMRVQCWMSYGGRQ